MVIREFTGARTRGDFNHEHTSLGDLLGRLTTSPPSPIRYWHIQGGYSSLRRWRR